MYLLRKTKGLLILLIFFLLTSANASFTSNVNDSSDTIFNSPVGSKPAIYKSYRQEKGYINGQYNRWFNDITPKINRPSVNYEILNRSNMRTKSLPAGPRALLMSIAGFVCVSLVRDKRFWIHTLIGLICTGQTGLNILPHVISHLSTKKKDVGFYSFSFNTLYRPSNIRCLNGKIEDTRYIGLLRFLAGIPDSVISFQLEPYLLRRFDDRDYLTNSYGYAYQHTSESKDSINLVQSKKDELLSSFILYRSNKQYNNLIYIADQRIYFSQFFDFKQYPRGPPENI
jgi:hypothetical protein